MWWPGNVLRLRITKALLGLWEKTVATSDDGATVLYCTVVVMIIALMVGCRGWMPLMLPRSLLGPCFVVLSTKTFVISSFPHTGSGSGGGGGGYNILARMTTRNLICTISANLGLN